MAKRKDKRSRKEKERKPKKGQWWQNAFKVKKEALELDPAESESASFKVVEGEPKGGSNILSKGFKEALAKLEANPSLAQRIKEALQSGLINLKGGFSAAGNAATATSASMAEMSKEFGKMQTNFPALGEHAGPSIKEITTKEDVKKNHRRFVNVGDTAGIIKLNEGREWVIQPGDEATIHRKEMDKVANSLSNLIPGIMAKELKRMQEGLMQSSMAQMMGEQWESTMGTAPPQHLNSRCESPLPVPMAAYTVGPEHEHQAEIIRVIKWGTKAKDSDPVPEMPEHPLEVKINCEACSTKGQPPMMPPLMQNQGSAHEEAEMQRAFEEEMKTEKFAGKKQVVRLHRNIITTAKKAVWTRTQVHGETLQHAWITINQSVKYKGTCSKCKKEYEQDDLPWVIEWREHFNMDGHQKTLSETAATPNSRREAEREAAIQRAIQSPPENKELEHAADTVGEVKKVKLLHNEVWEESSAHRVFVNHSEYKQSVKLGGTELKIPPRTKATVTISTVPMQVKFEKLPRERKTQKELPKVILGDHVALSSKNEGRIIINNDNEVPVMVKVEGHEECFVKARGCASPSVELTFYDPAEPLKVQEVMSQPPEITSVAPVTLNFCTCGHHKNKHRWQKDRHGGGRHLGCEHKDCSCTRYKP